MSKTTTGLKKSQSLKILEGFKQTPVKINRDLPYLTPRIQHKDDGLKNHPLITPRARTIVDKDRIDN